MKCDELKDKWFNAYPEIMGIEGGEPTKCYGKDDVDAAITELMAKLESVQATAYAESVDAGMRERRLKRALYKACANWMTNRQGAMRCFNLEARARKFDKAIDKCRAKAEEYK